MCCFELHFHRTVFWVVTALWPEVLLLLEHSYSVTAARSSASPTLEKGKIIIDFFLTLPKLVWTRNALGGCWPLLSKCRIRLVTRKKQQQSWCIAHTFKTRRVVSPTSILKTTMLPDPPLSQIIQLYEQLGGSCSSLPDAPVEFEVPKKKKQTVNIRNETSQSQPLWYLWNSSACEGIRRILQKQISSNISGKEGSPWQIDLAPNNKQSYNVYKTFCQI